MRGWIERVGAVADARAVRWGAREWPAVRESRVACASQSSAFVGIMLGAALRVEEQQRELLLIVPLAACADERKETANVGSQQRNGG